MWGNTGAVNDAVLYIPSGSSYVVDQTRPFQYKYIFTPQELNAIKWYKSGNNAVYATGPCLNIPYDTAVDYYVARYDNYVNCAATSLNFSDTLFVTSERGTVVGLPYLQEGRGINVKAYPNPAQNKVQLEAKETAIRSLIMVDRLGRTILSRRQEGNSSALTIDIKGIQSGLYILIIETDKGRVLRRIVKS
ncbi:hypothetical protein DBR32_07885 [Taibaiella sp. KBW10]|uniref:T9SS type A sorting domain-containing protein n=1 Tax=Taibaiella sp. KBW10 TaxID=2153357 RepID=UPI000F5A22E9|nr:T9SS type A sorting domain-containing protein [Taibaiella sp. KBW10]RQO30645.1 hypothetical protein DBR32_07885 [Taibaiella sp. KBW10]